MGSAKFNKKTRVLTWSVANSVLVKKNATVKMSLKAGKKGSYKISPSISSTGNKVIGKKDIKFKVKWYFLFFNHFFNVANSFKIDIIVK